MLMRELLNPVSPFTCTKALIGYRDDFSIHADLRRKVLSYPWVLVGGRNPAPDLWDSMGTRPLRKRWLRKAQGGAPRLSCWSSRTYPPALAQRRSAG
jgi:hypothetical protein